MKTTHSKSIISSTPADIGNPQANWDRKKFDDAISDKGSNCFIERAMRCPCAQPPSGQALVTCTNCGGSGWFFIDKQETRMVITTMSSRSKYEAWSETNAGIVNVSCRPQDRLGFMDKITINNLESWFTQVVKLKPSTTTNTKYFSFLIYNPVEVFDVYLYINSDVSLYYLTKDVHYVIDFNKILLDKSFIDSLEVEGIPALSIRYTHNPVYHVIDISRETIKQKSVSDFEGINLDNFPLHCVARKAHYILDNPDFSGNSLFDNTNYSKTTPNYDR